VNDVSVTFGRDWLLYNRNGRKMSITADAGAYEIVVFRDTVSRWDDTPMDMISNQERNKILQDIEDALSRKGLTARFVD
jgi:hypothetical protein